MAKKKQSPAKTPSAADPGSPNAVSPIDASLPSAHVRSLLTVALMAHGFLLLVSYGSIVEPSDVQGRLKNFFSWYLNPLHLNVDGRPVFLLHEDDDEAAIRFQVRVLTTDPSDDPSSDAGWQPVPPVGWVGGEQRKRYQRWAATTARAAQQQEVGLAGTLARRAVIDDDARTIRLVLLNNPLIEQIPEFDRELYRAAIVREADQVRFVQLSEPRENALALERAESTAESTDDSEDAMIDGETESPHGSSTEAEE